MDASNHRRNVEQVFRDFRGRRAGIIKALTTDVEEFYGQCDPDKENLCLYARPDEQWEVMLPSEEMPAELPEPVVGINFAREGLEQGEWVKLVAVHSDAWLVGVLFYTAGKAGLNKTDRNRLFTMVNDLPTVCEIVTGAAAEKAKASVSNRSTRKSKSNSKSGKSSKPQTNDEEEGAFDDEEALCGACGESYASGEFWICCDFCDKWFHGNCVKVTAAKAEHIKRYKCPLCTSKRVRR